MKSIIFVSLVLCAGTIKAQDSFPSTPSLEPTTKPSAETLKSFEFVLQSRDTSYRPGVPIFVDAFLRNRSALPIRIAERRGAEDAQNCIPLVLDAAGKRVALTEYGRKLFIDEKAKGFIVWRSKVTELAKSETLENVLELTKIYDLSKPGTYSAVALRHILNDHGNYVFPVTSNVLKIVVIQGKPKGDIQN